MTVAQTLRLEGFSYRHAGAKSAALSDIDLEVGPGEFVLVTGRSGSGKSTLIRASCGLAPAFDGGTAAGLLAVGGLDAREHGPGEIARGCGTVLQDPDRQVVMTTVRAELSLPLESRGFSATATARAVEETALLLGLADLLDRPVSELSGGELQRAALGAAVAPCPPLLLLDEPVSQLDPVAADDFGWLLRRLNEEQGVAIVVAEQRIERMISAADRVVALVDGRVACDAPPAAYLDWAASSAPDLLTPAAELFDAAGLAPLPTSVKEARAGIEHRGGLAPARTVSQSAPALAELRRRRVGRRAGPALMVDRLWDERTGGPAILRGVSLAVESGETVALMGRNGAGKSTLLGHAAGIAKPTRGRVEADGRVALMLQSPDPYLVHERLDELAGPAIIREAGLEAIASRHPRELSGGEKQRMALALVTASTDGVPPKVLLLDEPTTGLDRLHRVELAGRLARLADQGVATVIATHDAEFAALACSRVVLLAEGAVIADAPTCEVLTGGWHFATETARVLGGAGGALLPLEGARVLAGAGLAGVGL